MSTMWHGGASCCTSSLKSFRAFEDRFAIEGAQSGQSCSYSVPHAPWKVHGRPGISLPSAHARPGNLLPSLHGASDRRPMWPTKTSFVNSSPTLMKVRSSLKGDPPVLEVWSMDEAYDILAHRLLEATKNCDPSCKYIVGMAGSPGAGKTTVAAEVVSRLNVLWKENRPLSKETGEIAVTVPMDGFHLYKWQLDAMEDPGEAHARRGAPWTFDPVRMADCLGTLREKGSVSLPSFDHGVGDPIEDDIVVEDRHRVVVVEGNYVLCSEGAWSDLSVFFDERWFVDVDLDEAMSRVEKRHVLTGKPPDVAKWRVAHNDRPNAELIQESRWNADLLIQSVPLAEVA